MVCEVPTCPAETIPGYRVCPIHRYARLAEGIPLLEFIRCAVCKRVIQPTDWIHQQFTEKYATHVHCDPKRVTSRRIKPDDPKPLLDLA